MTVPRTSTPVSPTRLKRHSARLVHDVQEKTTWFINNIAKTHPKPSIYLRSRRATIRRRKSTWSAEGLKEGETISTRSHSKKTCSYEASPPRALRSSKKVKSLQEDSDSDSDLEDFGQLCSVANEDSTRSGFTQYHSAVSHVSNLDDMAAIAELSIIDEDSGIAFTSSPQRCKERSVNDPALFQISCSRSFEDGASRFTIQPPRTPYLLAAPTPSIVLTMPTPQISQSPVFQPRSPITLAKYVQATASSQSPCLTPAVSTSSLSPVPSIPSCNRCCLAQLEDGVICRACERQWLACKMWYQAHDGGRRLQLTEPFIRPAESNANVRAVMGVLGVPGSTATVGLGFEPSVTLRKKLPFKVVERAIQPPCSRCNYDSCARPGNCRDRATPWRRLRKHSLDAVKKTRDTLRALFGLHLHSSLSFKSVSAVPPPRSWSCLPRGDLAFTSPATPDSSAASWTARIAPYRLAHCSSEPSPSYGSSLFHRQLACVTSGSRFVEHLVV